MYHIPTEDYFQSEHHPLLKPNQTLPSQQHVRRVQNTPMLHPPLLRNFFNHLSRNVNDLLLFSSSSSSVRVASTRTTTPVPGSLPVPFFLPPHQKPALLHRKRDIFVPQPRSSRDVYERTPDVEVLAGRSVGRGFRVRGADGAEGGFYG